MVDENTKLYTEDGEYVGTVGELRDAFKKGLESTLNVVFDKIYEDAKREIYAVSKESECPEQFVRFHRGGCTQCRRKPYCDSYMKEES